MTSPVRWLFTQAVWTLAVASVGTVVLVVPSIVLGVRPTRAIAETSWPWALNGLAAWEAWPSAVVLAGGQLILGATVGAVRRGYHPWTGVCSVAILPLASLVDLSDHGDHNLLGIEWAIYAVFGLPTLVGSLVGAAIARRRDRRRTPVP